MVDFLPWIQVLFFYHEYKVCFLTMYTTVCVFNMNTSSLLWIQFVYQLLILNTSFLSCIQDCYHECKIITLNTNVLPCEYKFHTRTTIFWSWIQVSSSDTSPYPEYKFLTLNTRYLPWIQISYPEYKFHTLK